jgi:hypothetical protein
MLLLSIGLQSAVLTYGIGTLTSLIRGVHLAQCLLPKCCLSPYSEDGAKYLRLADLQALEVYFAQDAGSWKVQRKGNSVQQGLSCYIVSWQKRERTSEHVQKSSLL